MTKILLINPPLLDQTKYNKPPLLSATPGTGLSYLYSFLKKNNFYDCKIYDFYFDDWKYIHDTLKKEMADVIGITCLTEGRANAFKLISLIRKIKENTIIIFGGHHSTYMYDQILLNYDIDYVILGEGEVKLLNLLQYIEGKIPLKLVDGIAYKKGRSIIKNMGNIHNYIDNLDDLPFPFSEEQMEIFDKYPDFEKIRPFEAKKLSENIYKRNKMISIITSRGCPFNCQFCSSTLFWGKKWRFRTPENIADEIEYYYKKFGFRYFNFADDAFTIIPKRSIGICKEIINRNLKIQFDCTTRSDRITDELAIWLKKAGCIQIALGVESGSKKILKTINKNLSINSIIKAFNILNKHNLDPYPLLMVGNPGDSRETIKKTISLLRIIKPNRVAVSITMVFPGTELFNLSMKQGFIDKDYWLSEKPPPFYTFEHSLKKLRKWSFEVYNYKKTKYQLKILKLKIKSVRIIKFVIKNTLKNYNKIREYVKIRFRI